MMMASSWSLPTFVVHWPDATQSVEVSTARSHPTATVDECLEQRLNLMEEEGRCLVETRWCWAGSGSWPRSTGSCATSCWPGWWTSPVMSGRRYGALWDTCQFSLGLLYLLLLVSKDFNMHHVEFKFSAKILETLDCDCFFENTMGCPPNVHCRQSNVLQWLRYLTFASSKIC